MKKLCLLFVLVGMLLQAGRMQAQDMLAFPGADGYGKYTTGGRGGEVCYVTRTDDCSDNDLVEGTLRWALRHDNGGKPRTVLFATSGTIYLTSKLKLQYPDVSILGQSAPGGGITITGYPMYICRDNVIIRYIRFRAGDIPNESLTGLDMENCDNVIIDHCSMTWSMEECLTAYDTDYTTVQWCIIGEGLYNSKNSKGARAYATQWGGEHSTMHHTLITNSHSRSPRFNGVRSVSNNPGDHDQYVDSEFANNVIFNWSGYNSIYGGENYPECKGYNRVYMINNYFRPGPSTQKGTSSRRYFVSASGSLDQVGQWYFNGNKFETSSKFAPTTTVWSDAELEKVNNDNLYGLLDNNSSRAINYWSLTPSQELYDKSIMTTRPDELSGLAYETADEAFLSVTTKAGASLPRYDEVDTRLLQEAAGTVDPRFTGSLNELGIIDSPDDVKLSYTDTYVVDGVTYNNMPRMFVEGQDKYMIDSDADGMPDKYEDEMGFNKNDAADGAAYAGNGYTNLENYLNGIADGTINKTKYETSAEYVEPGPEVTPPETVTAVFTNTDAKAEGQVPAQITVKYGETITLPVNRTLYKDGYTLTGWLGDGKLYTPGQTVTLKKETVTLTAIYTQNKVNMPDRITDVNVTWDFTEEGAPSLSGSGIYVTQSYFSGADHDVRLKYEDASITLPACEGAKVTVTTAEAVEEYTATGDTYVYDATGKQIESISVDLPYVWNTPDRVYYAPEIMPGEEYMIFYTTPENAAAADWIQGTYKERTDNRTFYDPEVDDNSTYYLGPALVVNNSDQTLDMFVTGTTKVRVFISNQSSYVDRGVLTATPSDGTAPVSVQSANLTQKQMPYVLELQLDKEKQYRLQVSTANDYEISVGAVKFYGDAPEITEGDAEVAWPWEGTPDVDGVKSPSTIFTTAASSYNQDVYATSSKTAFDETFAGFKPAAETQFDTPDVNYAMTFDIQPAQGVYFIPQEISFKAVKFGTDSGLFDVTVQQDGGQETTVLKGGQFTRNNAASLSATTIDLSAVDGIVSTTGPLKVRIYLYSMYPGKEFGFNNIKVSGKFNGNAPEAKTYTFTAKASPAEAANVIWSPEGDVFEDGTKIAVTAEPNSGYLFEGWVNQDGDKVSETESFTYTIKSDTELTAVYRSYDDYDYIFDAAPYDAAVKTINELKVALSKAAERTDQTQRYRIFLHNGTYDYGSSVKNEVKGGVSLIGESQEGVIIMNKATSTSNHAETTPTIFIDQNQNDVYMQDLTIRQGRDWDTQKSTGQAMAVRQRGKRAVYKNVTLQGIQDTYYLNKADATAYFETSTIAGEVDYVYGDGTAWLEKCNLYNTGAGYITAPNTQPGYWGFVMNECTVSGADAAAGKFCLGRPWGDSPHATFINTTFNQLPTEAGWGKMQDGLVLRFHEYGSVDANGSNIDLSKRSLDACSPAADSDNPVLTAEEAAKYTIGGVFGEWNPQALTVQLAAPEVVIDEETNTLSWNAVPEALGYAIVKDGSVVAFTTASSFSLSEFGAGTYSIRVANEMGGLGEASNTTTGISSITVDGLDGNAPKYNVAGQRVDNDYKGVVIQKGKKFIKK